MIPESSKMFDQSTQHNASKHLKHTSEDLTESCPLRAISGFARIAIGVISDILTSRGYSHFAHPKLHPPSVGLKNPWVQISSICLPQENDLKIPPTKIPMLLSHLLVGNPWKSRCQETIPVAGLGHLAKP